MIPLSTDIWNKSKQLTIVLLILIATTLAAILLTLNYRHKVDVLRSLANIIAEQTSNKMNSGEWADVLKNIQDWKSLGIVSYLEVRHGSELLLGPIKTNEHFFNICSQLRTSTLHIDVCSPVLRQTEIVFYIGGFCCLLILIAIGISLLRRKTLSVINKQMEQLASLTMPDMQVTSAPQTNIQEFITVQKKLQQLISEAGDNSRAAEKLSNTRRFAHDVRFIVDLIGDKEVNESIQRDPLNALKKVRELAHSYLGSTASEKLFIEPSSLITDWVEDARTLHPNTNIAAKIISDGYIFFPAFELRSILWNSLKNSIEAIGPSTHLNFRVELSFDKGRAKILIFDNARCSSTMIARLNTKNFFSGKSTGYGIGVKSLVEVVERYGGEVFFSQRDGALCITIFLQRVGGAIDTGYSILHIDDDKYTRLNWMRAFEGVNIPIISRASLMEVNPNEEIITERCIAFIDVELEEGGSGLEVAKVISRSGGRHIYLTTSYMAEDVQIPNFVRGVLGKEAPV